MLLAFATTAIAFIDLGIFNPIVAMTIAVTKATLVVLFFMHVRYQGRLTFGFAIAGSCSLLILLLLISTDYLTRDWLPVPGAIPPMGF
jgi:cytochrome c oxidase subunit 4